MFIAFAHRGGAYHPEIEGLENTMAAFRHAYDLGYRSMETDVHLTADGHLVAFHDDVLDRVTDSTGAIAELSLAQVRAARIGQEQVPTLAELVDAFPDATWNVDLKADGAVEALAEFIEQRQSYDAFLVATFSPARLTRFRRRTRGRVATAAHTGEVLAFRLLPGAIARRVSKASALQIPVTNRGITVLTDRLIARAHAAGVPVHIWTIDEASAMIHLIDRGVDGIFTDRTDTLRSVLIDRGLWQEGPSNDGSAADSDH